MKKYTVEQVKAIQAQTPNGWKLDAGALLYQFAHGDEYPKIFRTVEKTAEFEIVEYLHFFKHWNGKAEYRTHLTKFNTADEGERVRCGVVYGEKVIEQANRFNLKRLLQLAEQITAESVNA